MLKGNSLHLINMDSISIRLRSKAETSYFHLSYINLLYSKIRKRFMKNNAFCGHYYNAEDVPQFTLYYKSKPLPDRLIHYSLFNIREGDYIELEYIGLRGGAFRLPHNVLLTFRTLHTLDINVPFETSYSIQRLATRFGCWLFENNYEAEPCSIIQAIVSVNNIDTLLPRSIWHNNLESFSNCSITLIYRSLSTCDQIVPTYDYMWPESDFEFDSDSDSSFTEQSGQIISSTRAFNFLAYITGRTSFDQNYLAKLAEDLTILVDGLYECYTDSFCLRRIVRTIVIFLKLRSNSSILKMFEDSKILDYINELLHVPEEESGVMKFLDNAENIVNTIKSGKRLKITKVMYRLGMFALSLSLFDSFGLDLDLLGYSAFDKELLKRKTQLTGDTMLDLADGVIFLLKKGYQIIMTGRVDCIYHTDDEYSALYDDISDLKLKKIALGNPEALGFNEYWYGDKLDKTMDKLRNVIKYAGTLDKTEIRYWRSQLCELELIKNNILIAKNCSESRECPFSVLFFASPGVGKSTLTKMTFQHLAKTHDLPTEDKFMYVRNPMAKYADGFKSEMHTYLLDDISFKHPAANPTGDISLDEVYMLHGTFQYVPDQAALEDKGRIPVRIKFLLGTTNVKDLNAYHYFSVPSAMQRRFPYIVEVNVKKEFQMDDGSGMLDATKTNCAPEDYPDYWILKVSKIVVPKNMGELAKLRHIGTFRDINEFTAWLSKTSVKHFDNEKIMTNSFTNMRTVEICKTCFKNIKFCKCSREQTGSVCESMLSGLMYYFAFCLIAFYRALASILFASLYWRIRTKVETNLTRFGFDHVNIFVRKQLFVRLAKITRRNIGYPEAFGILAGLIITGYAIFRFNRSVTGPIFTEQTRGEVKELKNTDARPPKPGTFEKELTWVANDKKLSTIDLTPQILSSKQHTREEFVDKVANNVIRLMIYDSNEPKQRYINNAIVLKSNIIVCNAHFFNNIKFETFNMVLVCDELGDGVNDKIEVSFNKKNIIFDISRDIAIFVVHSLVPRKDITQYFAKLGVYTEATGTLIGRDYRSGVISKNTVHNVTLENNYSDTFGAHPFSGPVTFGKSVLATIDGDCGSMLVAHTPKGHFIASFHRASNTDKVVIGVILYYEDVERLIQKVSPLAVSSGYPKLADGHTIQSLHPKSVFNYIEEGSAQVFGSISSYKSNQKSSVCATPMRDFLVEHEKYPVDYRAPQLRGYQPYYLAGKDLVSPIIKFDENLLRVCAESFLKDILKNVPHEELNVLVHKYDMFTATNGAAGVAFVDSINRSTSTGYPYCTSKKKFLSKLPPTNGLQDPVEFDKEIVEEVYRMIDEYTAERRCHPVYVGTLKDEPVSFLKYAMGKTRLFGSAPISFILVQRIYFLATIRLMQTHKMAFECAIGVIAQTKEWELFYKKLLRFPTMIAGDFSKFDKQMCPLVIMLAYWILIEIAKKSGNFTPEDILIMRGIATDTAYPFMLFNGDFVQLFGSNPSGHSLTVIINSLVNSIYLRYVYTVLYKLHNNTDLPDAEIVATFKEHVELFVYGDDNQASTDLDWFNFQNIQKAFSDVGIKYTPPTKDDTNYKFMDISEVDFLKRSYRYDSDLGAIVAPLSEDSLNKMLTTWVASDSISPEVQTLAVISSAIREYFFHGREVFDYKREMFVRLLKHLDLEHGINTTVLPTYEMLVDRYNDASCKILARLPQHSFVLQSGLVEIPTCGFFCAFGFVIIFIMFVYTWFLLSVLMAFLSTRIIRIYSVRFPRYNILEVLNRTRRLPIVISWADLCHYINRFSVSCIDIFFSFIYVFGFVVMLPFLVTYVHQLMLKRIWARRDKIFPTSH
jgi:hypothetical protein